jgi:hypothetical protein
MTEGKIDDGSAAAAGNSFTTRQVSLTVIRIHGVGLNSSCPVWGEYSMAVACIFLRMIKPLRQPK